eukprot:560283-Rhodomonas_salina.1
MSGTDVALRATRGRNDCDKNAHGHRIRRHVSRPNRETFFSHALMQTHMRDADSTWGQRDPVLDWRGWDDIERAGPAACAGPLARHLDLHVHALHHHQQHSLGAAGVHPPFSSPTFSAALRKAPPRHTRSKLSTSQTLKLSNSLAHA